MYRVSFVKTHADFVSPQHGYCRVYTAAFEFAPTICHALMISGPLWRNGWRIRLVQGGAA